MLKSNANDLSIDTRQYLSNIPVSRGLSHSFPFGIINFVRLVHFEFSIGRRAHLGSTSKSCAIAFLILILILYHYYYYHGSHQNKSPMQQRMEGCLYTRKETALSKSQTKKTWHPGIELGKDVGCYGWLLGMARKQPWIRSLLPEKAHSHRQWSHNHDQACWNWNWNCFL